MRTISLKLIRTRTDKISVDVGVTGYFSDEGRLVCLSSKVLNLWWFFLPSHTHIQVVTYMYILTI